MNKPTNEPCCAVEGCDKPVALPDIEFMAFHTKTTKCYTRMTYTEEDFIENLAEEHREKWKALPYAERERVWKEKMMEEFPFYQGTDYDEAEESNHFDSWDEESTYSEDRDWNDVGLSPDIDRAADRVERHLIEEVFPTPEERKERQIADLKKQVEKLDDDLFAQAEKFKAEFMKKVADARASNTAKVEALRKQIADLTLPTA